MNAADRRLEVIASEMFVALGSERQFSPSAPPYDLLTIADAYRITKKVADLRLACGERIVGRKIGFTNHEVWGKRGFKPMWGYVYDTTSRSLTNGEDTLSLEGFAEPRIEPEIVLSVKVEPKAAMSDADLLASIEWVAQGFEIVQSRFVDWRFTDAAAIASYGLHGFLLIGKSHPITAAHDWLSSLRSVRVDLIRDGMLTDRGHARNVLGGPLSALRCLLEILEADPLNPPVKAGEVITTGTLTGVPPIKAGESLGPPK